MAFKFLMIFTLFTGLSASCFAKVADEIGFGMGMAMVSFAEQESSLEGDNIEEAASGSFSSISSMLYWKFFHREKYDVYMNALLPLLGAGDNSVISVGAGMEYYLTKENHRLEENVGGMKLYVDPKIRYYIIGEVNAIYISYLTETSKKNDINIEFGGGGGLTYSFDGNWKDWGLRGSAVVGRGLGVITSTFNVKAFLSVIHYLDI